METEKIAQRVMPGERIYIFSQDEVKEIMLKAALEKLKQNEPPLTKEEMYHRVELIIEDGENCGGDWRLVLNVEQPRIVSQHPYN